VGNLGKFRLRSRLDFFSMALIGTVALAAVLPVYGSIAVAVAYITKVAIALLFFLHGIRLPREAILQGLRQWRLQLLVLLLTFALFPLIGLLLGLLPSDLLPQGIYVGILYLCMLPSTVQSSIAFTSIARGNVAAAICAATISNVVGMALTPVLVTVLMGRGDTQMSGDAAVAIAFQLALPFLAGQVLRPWLFEWSQRRRELLSLTDRSSILLVVYGAFSEAIVSGIFGTVSLPDLGLLMALLIAILATVMAFTRFCSRKLKFAPEDEIAAFFCGSKKSLASGVPMARILFSGPTVGLTLVPLMLFHQLQLMVCAVIARKYSERA
jgi:sodium/bile acid cotransporter 7